MFKHLSYFKYLKFIVIRSPSISYVVKFRSIHRVVCVFGFNIPIYDGPMPYLDLPQLPRRCTVRVLMGAKQITSFLTVFSILFNGSFNVMTMIAHGLKVG
jgi:hypothetical protein